MGRDNHNNKTGGNNTNSLPQTPKNQKIKPGDMNEEIAKEFAELRKAIRKEKKVLEMALKSMPLHQLFRCRGVTFIMLYDRINYFAPGIDKPPSYLVYSTHEYD